MRLLTNNPAKRAGARGVRPDASPAAVPLPVQATADNLRYLRTKRDRMGHDLRGRLVRHDREGSDERDGRTGRERSTAPACGSAWSPRAGTMRSWACLLDGALRRAGRGRGRATRSWCGCRARSSSRWWPQRLARPAWTPWSRSASWSAAAHRTSSTCARR